MFLDRDGTLNRKAPDGEYIRAAEDLELLPGAGTAVRRVNSSDMLAILITNQRWISADPANKTAYEAVDMQLHHSLAAHDAWLDAAYMCPHPLNRCLCRKPQPGMLLRAKDEWNIDLRESFVVGDSISDVQAGIAVGATAVLIGHSMDDTESSGAAFQATAIEEALNWVLSQSG